MGALTTAANQLLARTRYRLVSLRTLTHHADNMMLFSKNADFINDARFARAYAAGVATDNNFEGLHAACNLHIEWRVAICCWAASAALHLKGDFVECGVNTGLSSRAICEYVDFNKIEKAFWLFDTFKGIPPEDAKHSPKKEIYRECYDLVRSNFAGFSNVHLVRGKVPDTLHEVAINSISYLSIDMNVAAPERAAMEHFWPRMVSGSIVVLDDYGFAGHEAQKRSHDQFAASQGVEIWSLPTGQGLILKP